MRRVGGPIPTYRPLLRLARRRTVRSLRIVATVGRVRWTLVTPGQWVLLDEDGSALRQVQERGPYLGDPTVSYLVTGGRDGTDHPTLDLAKAAAEASL
ncbi:MAG: hypothetical protein M3063_03385 [Actinomycetota bacterium]|nr:hypothetical protein [Actinomycetota bacterium]